MGLHFLRRIDQVRACPSCGGEVCPQCARVPAYARPEVEAYEAQPRSWWWRRNVSRRLSAQLAVHGPFDSESLAADAAREELT